MEATNTTPTQPSTQIVELISPIQIPEFLIGEIQSKLAYADEKIISAQVNTEKILIIAKPISADEKSALIEKVERVITSMAKGSIRPKIQILEDHTNRPTPYLTDPMPELLQRGEISQESDGIFALGPLLTRLIAYFETRLNDLADSFQASPYRFPTLIPASYLERVNYFRSFPHSLTFATHLREDVDIIDQFAQYAMCDHEGLQTPPESFARVQALLSPAVCYHLYFSLADRPLQNGRTIATAVGNCFRYEAINLNSLERLWNFTMWEVIFVGPKDFVLENREIARQRMSRVFEQIGFAYRVESATDPFFIGEFRKQAAFQSAFQLKYEVRANLPYKNSTLAVGSYNYHQDFFGRSLNITLPDGSPAHTGCVAFGLERVALAFLAQFGLDRADWPAEVREMTT